MGCDGLLSLAFCLWAFCLWTFVFGLLQLDSNGFLSLGSLYAWASSTGDWPAAVVAGAVKSLAKVPSPTSPDHFRPVTVFSLVYRAWSSAVSRFWLSKLDSVRIRCSLATGLAAEPRMLGGWYWTLYRRSSKRGSGCHRPDSGLRKGIQYFAKTAYLDGGTTVRSAC